jgi:hypothetical protein
VDHLDSSHARVKANYCRRCMHEHLRRPIQSPSEWDARYCPLQLFSSAPDCALTALYRDWALEPKPDFNNLRAFVDGVQVDRLNVCCACDGCPR